MERDQAIKFVLDLLKMMIAKEGSDLFVTVGFPPAIKVHGRVTPVTKTPLKPEDTKAMVYAVMRDKQLKEFEATNECNFAVSPPSIGRFRANAFVQQGHMGMILRTITTEVHTLEGLKLPDVLADIALTPYLNRLDMLGMDGIWKGRLPHLQAWWDRIRAMPNFVPCFLDYCPRDLTSDQKTFGTQSWPEVRKLVGI